jgi:hypothetical protein
LAEPEPSLAAVEHWCHGLLEAEARGQKPAVLRFILEALPPGGDSQASILRAGLLGALGDLDDAFRHLDEAVLLREIRHSSISPSRPYGILFAPTIDLEIA